MQIPYEVQARPDTGLYNAKLGIWLFLASEVMLFGGLFSAYVFLRLGAEPGYWPHGLLDVRVGTFNTAVLIFSSVTVVLAWASLKMRKFADYKKWMGITIICGALFLFIKLVFEYPAKFAHFGAFIRKDKWAEYEKYLGNEHMAAKKLAPRVEISGHLHEVELDLENADRAAFDALVKKRHLEIAHSEGNHVSVTVHSVGDAQALGYTPGAITQPNEPDAKKREASRKVPGAKILAFGVVPDPVHEDPTSPENEKPHFWPKHPNPQAHPVHIKAEDIDSWSAFVPRHSTYFSTYFMITGLHGAHVLGGVLVFCFMWGPGAALYKTNPEHLANRVEVAGLFWHFVDLIWIFVFPLFYLL
jgi:heme/copper-type cytochrome/quinol oxidase subunit 3